jgi:hypothetical protein
VSAPVTEAAPGYLAGGRDAAGLAHRPMTAPVAEAASGDLGGEGPGGRSVAGRAVSAPVAGAAPGDLGGDVLGGGTPRVSPADRGAAL